MRTTHMLDHTVRMGEYYCTGNTSKHLKNHNHQQSASVHNDLFQSSVYFALSALLNTLFLSSYCCGVHMFLHFPVIQIHLLSYSYTSHLMPSWLQLIPPTLDPSYTTFITTRLFQKHLERLSISLIHKIVPVHLLRNY